MKVTKHLFLSSFWLKIIGFVLMALDHIGYMALSSGLFPSSSAAYNVFVAFRYVGRLALPLFMFFLAEGLRHTKDRERYIMRLAIMWAAILVAQLIIANANIMGITMNSMPASPFTDLLMCGLLIYLLEHKNKKLRPLAILPLAVIIISFACEVSETYCYYNNATSVWSSYVPVLFRADYNVLGLLMFLGFYYARPLASRVASAFLAASAPLPPITLGGEEPKEPEEKPEFVVEETPEFQTLFNTICVASIVVANAIFYLIYRIAPQFDAYGMSVQSWGTLACVFLIFYNGKLGYHPKWWKWFEYLYFPLHIGIIALVFFLMSL